MKRTLLLLIVLGFALNISGYDKKTLVERFTNASCAPCASLNNSWYNTTTHSLINSGSISHIIYNVNWPGSNDPMYLLNPTDNMTRRTYYAVSWVPWPVINSVYFDYETMGQTQFVNNVNSGNAEYAPFNIVIVQRALSEDLVEIGVKIFRDPNDNTTFNTTKLRVGLTEKSVNYATAPGTNGETHFYSVCRKMLPDANGTTLTIPAPGDSVEVILQYVPTTAFLQSVNMDSLRIVAFIQGETNKTIYQSAMLEMSPNFVAQINSTSPDVISDNSTPAVFDAIINNVGTMMDKYAINCTLNSPVGWTGEFTTINGTFPIGTVDSIEVAPGNSTSVQVTINPQGIDGFGRTMIEFESQNNPGMSGAVTVNNVTNTGNNILVINGGDREYESAVTSALENVYTGTYGAVSRSALEPASVSLSNFDMVFWQGSNSPRSFYPDEVTKLQSYLDQGGNLFITGQDIGRDIFEPSGQSQFAQDFYHNYLHTNYVADISNLFLVKGVPNDIISDGLQFIANDKYPRSLDKISPRDTNAVAFLTYFNGPDVAGVRAEADNYRVVYMTAGLDQITDQAICDTIAARTIRWLAENVVTPTQEIEVVAHITNIDSTLGAEMVFEFEAINISLVQQKVFVVRTINNLPVNWSSSLCFGSNCFAPGLDSVITEPPFGDPLEPGDTLFASLHVTALQNDGTANVQIQVGSLQDPADRVTLDFSATTTPTSVENENKLVKDYYLDQNYPNPFNPSTRINFGLKKAGNVEIMVYNILGNKVVTLVNGFKSAGNHSVLFNASDFSSGVYFYKIVSEGFVQTRKMLMLK